MDKWNRRCVEMLVSHHRAVDVAIHREITLFVIHFRFLAKFNCKLWEKFLRNFSINLFNERKPSAMSIFLMHVCRFSAMPSAYAFSSRQLVLRLADSLTYRRFYVCLNNAGSYQVWICCSLVFCLNVFKWIELKLYLN